MSNALPEGRSRLDQDSFAFGDWLRVVPSVHGSAAFAAAVRRVFFGWQPDRIAVELPAAAEPWVIQGVRRLPSPSIVWFETHAEAGSPDEGKPEAERSYIPIDPADSLVEGVRLGLEHGKPVDFVDGFQARYQPPLIAIPDPDIAAGTGAATYALPVMTLPRHHRNELDRQLDRQREELIAWRVGALRDLGKVLLVCGLAHWPGIRRLLESPRAPVDDQEPSAAGLAHLHEDSIYGLFRELPFVAAHYERWRSRGPAIAVPEAQRRWAPERAVELLLERAERSYDNRWGEEVSRPSRRAIRRFSTKLAASSNSMVPCLYDLVVAAKGCQDDDLASEVYDLATRWPHQENPDGLPVEWLDPDELRRGFDRVPLLRRDPRAFGRGRDPTEIFRRRPGEGAEDDWRGDWQQGGLGGCSYVPEDLRQLEWIAYVRHEAPQYLQDQRTIMREFTGSMLDGIDIRETMRNWWRQRIVVREVTRMRGKVGPVVVLYEDEPLLANGHYPNCIVWPGENHDEGDLLLFSTMPGDKLVGPGISRCEYGGFASLPGINLGWWQDPWEILPQSGWVETKGELLIVCAALCAQETYVTCISPTAPRRAVLSRCARLGHPVIHIPSASFTPAALKKLRAFHVLASIRTRAIARDYIEPRPRGFSA